MKTFRTDVVVFVHAPTRMLATALVERFAAALTDDDTFACRFVSSSDDTGETRDRNQLDKVKP